MRNAGKKKRGAPIARRGCVASDTMPSAGGAARTPAKLYGGTKRWMFRGGGVNGFHGASRCPDTRTNIGTAIRTFAPQAARQPFRVTAGCWKTRSAERRSSLLSFGTLLVSARLAALWPHLPARAAYHAKMSGSNAPPRPPRHRP